MTLAAVDRLVHHATIFEINVDSHRRRRALERRNKGAGRLQNCSRPAEPVQPNPPAQPTALADRIEIELPDGSRLRVGSDVSLVALRRAVAALRG